RRSMPIHPAKETRSMGTSDRPTLVVARTYPQRAGAADSSDLKSPALLLLPLRSALFLQRLGWLFLRFLLSVHTLTHGSPPGYGERADFKPTVEPWGLLP